MTFSRFKPKRLLQFCPALWLLAISASPGAPALAQGEDEVFHYLIPLAEAVSLSESGLHEQAINKTSKLLADLNKKRSLTVSVNTVPVLRADTNGGDIYKRLQSEALALRGVSSFTLKRKPQAIADLKQAAALCPDHAYVLTDLGTVLVKSRKSKEAIATFTRALKLNPNIREAYFFRSRAYRQTGQLKEAKSDWIRAQSLWSEQQKQIDSLTEQIDKLARENKIVEALELDRQLLRIAPRDGLAVTGYADHLTADGKYQEALGFVSTAIALDSTLGYPYRIRSVINSQLQNIEAELRDANIAFAIEPRSLEALNARAIANLDADQPVQAIRDFNLFVKRNPDFADAYINRSTAYLRVGEIDKAVTDAKHSVALIPNSPYGYQCLGAALKRAGQFKEAREALETSLRYKRSASPDSLAMAHFNLGAVLHELKDPKSTEQFDEAIKLAPTLPDILLQRGAYNASLGPPDDGIKILTRKYSRNLDSGKVSKVASKPAIPRTNAGIAGIYGTSKPSKITLPKMTMGARLNPKVQKMPPPGPVVMPQVSSKNGSASAIPAPRKIVASLPDLNDCIMICDRLIETTPEKSETYFTRGMAHLCLKQYDQATSDFRKLADLTKSGFARQRALVLAYLAAERTGKSKETQELLDLASRESNTTNNGTNSSTISNTTGSTKPIGHSKQPVGNKSGRTDQNSGAKALNQSVPELNFFRNQTTESALLSGRMSPRELTRIHSYLAFHFKSLAEKTKAAAHAAWVLSHSDLASPELVLTAADND